MWNNDKTKNKAINELLEIIEEQEREIADLEAELRHKRAFSTYTLFEACDHRLANDHAFRILLYLRFRQGRQASTWVGVDLIAKNLGLSHATVKRGLERLRANGFLEVKRRRGTSSVRVVKRSVQIYGDRLLELGEHAERASDGVKLRSLDLPDLSRAGGRRHERSADAMRARLKLVKG